MLLWLEANLIHNHRLQTYSQLHEKGTQNKDSHTTLNKNNPLSFSKIMTEGHQEQHLKTRAQHKLQQQVGITKNP